VLLYHPVDPKETENNKQLFYATLNAINILKFEYAQSQLMLLLETKY